MANPAKPRSPRIQNESKTLKDLQGAIERLRPVIDSVVGACDTTVVEGHLRTIADQLYCLELDHVMRWRNEWVSGQYRKNDMVRDGEYLMVANKETADRAAPTPTGTPYWVADLYGTFNFSTLSVSASRLIIGQRYTVQGAGYMNQVRFLLPPEAAGATVSVFAVRNPTTDPVFEQLVPEFTVVDPTHTTGPNVFSVGPILLGGGVTFDVVMHYRPPVIGTNCPLIDNEWTYKRTDGDPSSGEINHQSGVNQDQMRIHETSKDDVNQSACLDNLGTGDTIAFGGTTWTIESVSKTGSVYTFIVDPPTRIGEGDYLLTGTYYADAFCYYLVDAGYYASAPPVDSVLATGEYLNAVIGNDAHGVDIQIQDAVVSPDWDLAAIS